MEVNSIFNNGITLSGSIDDSSILVPEIPGDLGQEQITLRDFNMLQTSLRDNINSNLYYARNDRFRGQRESIKFNYTIQQSLSCCVNNFLVLRDSDTALKTAEFSIYPSNNEISNINHIRLQMNFREWLILKDQNNVWFP
jgi:hypothetical protein